MRKKQIILAAALCLTLAACGEQNTPVNTPETSARPSAQPTESVVASTAAPTSGATAEPSIRPTDVPVTVSAEPSASGSELPSPLPSVEPTAAVTSTPEVTPQPAESAAQSPAPTESLCSLPVAPTPTPEGSAPPSASEAPAPVESQRPARPTDEEVLSAYKTAKEAMGWMTDSNSVEGYDDSGLALDAADQQTLTLTLGNGTEETLVFYRVTRPGLDSMEALWGYLKNLFSDEIVDDLMAFQVPVFVEGEQGGLYALPSQAQGFQQPGATLTVLWPEEEVPVSCQVRAVIGNEEAVRESLYQKVGDKWIFTQFEVPNSDKK